MVAIFKTLDVLLNLYSFFIILWVIMSWLVAFQVVPTYNRFVAGLMAALHQITEPALRPIRRIMPPLGTVDLSPIILLILIFFLRTLLREDIAPAFGVLY